MGWAAHRYCLLPHSALRLTRSQTTLKPATFAAGRPGATPSDTSPPRVTTRLPETVASLPATRGKWWIGTFEKYQGRAGERAGNTQGDQLLGTLQSAEFTLPAGSLTFLVGGGSAFETRVELIVLSVGGDPEFNQNRAFFASGRNTESMRRVTWDLAKYEGWQAFIRIVDASSGGWGHINADDFQFVPRQRVISPETVTRFPPGTMTRIDPEPTLVPNLRGKNLEQAREIIRESGLKTGNVQSVVPGYMEGPVIRQSPAPGTAVPPGSSLVLVLGGPPRVRVPPVIGMTVAEASRVLQRNRLGTGARREQTSPDHREGTVIEQKPSPGTEVTVGSVVDLVIAVRPEIVLVPVPDLFGMTPEQAEPRLGRLRLGLGEITSGPSRHQENTIFRQEPLPGRRVEPGTLVHVAVAIREQVNVPPVAEDPPAVEDPPEELEPPAAGVQVPDVVGLDFPDARKKILAAGLAVGSLNETASGLEAGTVLRQQPNPGLRVAPGAALSLSIAVAKPNRYLLPLISSAGLILLAVGALLLWKRPRKAVQGEDSSLHFELEITPNPDPGKSRIESGHPIDQDFEIRLSAVGDPGTQTIEAHDGLIKHESKKP